MKINTALVFFKSKTLVDGSHPIMLRVNFNKQRKYFATGVSGFEKDWDPESERLIGKGYREQNYTLETFDSDVRDVLDHFRINQISFSFELFTNKLLGGINSDIFEFFDDQIELFEQKGQIGNKDVYTVAKNRLKAFHKPTQLSFNQITPSFLTRFEGFLMKNGCNSGGVHNYFRTIRALFNKAISEGATSAEFYPFKSKLNAAGYDMSKFKSNYNPKSLSLEDIEKFKNFDFKKYAPYENTWRIALFTYFSKGMNYTDLAYLEWQNIYDNRISYTRKKTGKHFTLSISDALETQLNYFKGIHPNYIFNILSEIHETPQQQKDRIKKCRKKFNKELKEIGELLKLEVKLTSYVFRHTYATTLKRKGVSIELISESMGHKNVETTNHYLKRFENTEIDALDKFL